MTPSPASAQAARNRLDTPSLAALRLHRQGLIAEHRRCGHLRRLLRARLDLTVVETMPVPVAASTRTAAAPGTADRRLCGDDPPSTIDILLLVAGAAHATDGSGVPTDLVGRLQELEVALRGLAMYSEELQRDIDAVTLCFVEALAADPSSCLLNAPTRSVTSTAGVVATS